MGVVRPLRPPVPRATGPNLQMTTLQRTLRPDCLPWCEVTMRVRQKVIIFQYSPELRYPFTARYFVSATQIRMFVHDASPPKLLNGFGKNLARGQRSGPDTASRILVAIAPWLPQREPKIWFLTLKCCLCCRAVSLLLSVRLSVCLSVGPSRSCILSKRRNIFSNFFSP